MCIILFISLHYPVSISDNLRFNVRRLSKNSTARKVLMKTGNRLSPRGEGTALKTLWLIPGHQLILKHSWIAKIEKIRKTGDNFIRILL
jgi:hypothetical protein